MLNLGINLAKDVANIARRAGNEIMKIYKTDFHVETKDDNSPVTLADKAAEDIILMALRNEVSTDYPIVSEEAAAEGNIPEIHDTPFWLVDPLDGTKEFINRNGEFTVNVALIKNSSPVFGVVYLPVDDITFFGCPEGAFRTQGKEPSEQIFCRPPPLVGLTALVSRSHRTSSVDEYLTKFVIAREISAGSSLKFCRLAEGFADIYPRLSKTMEWDTAAGHAVLKFAGGIVNRLDGKELHYGKTKFENPYFVAASPGIMNI